MKRLKCKITLNIQYNSGWIISDYDIPVFVKPTVCYGIDQNLWPGWVPYTNNLKVFSGRPLIQEAKARLTAGGPTGFNNISACTKIGWAPHTTIPSCSKAFEMETSTCNTEQEFGDLNSASSMEMCSKITKDHMLERLLQRYTGHFHANRKMH